VCGNGSEIWILVSHVIQEILGVPGWSRDVCVIWVRAVTGIVNVTPVGRGGWSRDVSVFSPCTVFGGFREVVVVSDTPAGESRDVTVRSVCALFVWLPEGVSGCSVTIIGPDILVEVCVGTTIVVTLLASACRGKTWAKAAEDANNTSAYEERAIFV
jgi:hypothetical protein